MGYPKIGYGCSTDKTALDDELYALLKRVKRSSPHRSDFFQRTHELIAAGADVNQAGRPKGPLMAVVLYSNLSAEGEDIFKALLEHGADPNLPVAGLSTYVGQLRTAYSHVAQIAVSERILPSVCIRLITLLAESGADLNRQTRHGCTALDNALWRLWQWEHWFDLQRLRGQDGPYIRELELGFSLLTCARPFSSLVETILELGGRPSLCTEDQAIDCLERMERIREGCMDARNEALDKAAASRMEVEEYFTTTRIRDAEPRKGFAQMDVGEATVLAAFR